MKSENFRSNFRVPEALELDNDFEFSMNGNEIKNWNSYKRELGVNYSSAEKTAATGQRQPRFCDADWY